ncbi:hypothetical protein ACLB2K_048391 [Fragaria x ananassa]
MTYRSQCSNCSNFTSLPPGGSVDQKMAGRSSSVTTAVCEIVEVRCDETVDEWLAMALGMIMILLSMFLLITKHLVIPVEEIWRMRSGGSKKSFFPGAHVPVVHRIGSPYSVTLW